MKNKTKIVIEIPLELTCGDITEPYREKIISNIKKSIQHKLHMFKGMIEKQLTNEIVDMLDLDEAVAEDIEVSVMLENS